MTMPTLMNCAHMEDGWCIPCVDALNTKLRALAAEAAKQQARRDASRWIPVRDGKPPDDSYVLMWMSEHPQGRGRHRCYIGRYEAWRDWWRPEGSNGDFSDQVTHWMKLPVSPEDCAQAIEREAGL